MSNVRRKAGSAQPKVIDPADFPKLLNSKTDSDVIIMLGEGKTSQRIPGHSWVLARGSDYFKSLFYGPTTNPYEKLFEFFDEPVSFNNMIKWLYIGQCNFTNLENYFNTLELAIRYICPGLAIYCVENMSSAVTVDNVLTVLQWIHSNCASRATLSGTHKESRDTEEEAQEGEGEEAESKDEKEEDDGLGTVVYNDPAGACHKLLHLCLKLVDQETEKVLATQAFENIEAPVLQVILQRSGLTVTSELSIVKALYRWASADCKRQKKNVDFSNRRVVLGNMIYLARMLTLSQDDLGKLKTMQNKTPMYKGDEVAFFNAYVNQEKHPTMPYNMDPYVKPMSTARSPRQPDAEEESKDQSPPKQMGKKYSKQDVIQYLVSCLAIIFD